jgi:spore photoproduct lyase
LNLIERILIDSRVRDEPLAARVLAHKGSIPVEWVDEEAAGRIIGRAPLSEGKRLLYLTRFPGALVKPCPATSLPYLCCRYTVVNQIRQCPMDCTYCILQGYLESPVVTLYANTDSALNQVDQLLAEHPNRLFRFGTGELGDSLALDDLTGLSEIVVDFFSSRKNAVLELKTKTDRVERLLRLHPKNTVVSWSLNPQPVITREEFRAAPLAARLEAARLCQDRGYLLGFHFDPILYYEGWSGEYETLIRRLFEHVDASRIAWISLGTLRFPPALKEIMEERFPRSRIASEEMVRGLDGKMRYLRPRRTELLRRIHGLLMDQRPDLFVYFCMEHPAVWESVAGMHPQSNGELDFWFAQNLYFKFPELNATKPIRAYYTEQEE